MNFQDSKVEIDLSFRCDFALSCDLYTKGRKSSSETCQTRWIWSHYSKISPCNHDDNKYSSRNSRPNRSLDARLHCSTPNHIPHSFGRQWSSGHFRPRKVSQIRRNRQSWASGWQPTRGTSTWSPRLQGRRSGTQIWNFNRNEFHCLPRVKRVLKISKVQRTKDSKDFKGPKDLKDFKYFYGFPRVQGI